MEQPIAVVVNAQEVGRLFALHTSPQQYSQYILEKLRDLGGPVEGVLELKLTHGRMARVRDNAPGLPPGQFIYVWLPEEMVTKMLSEQIGEA